MDFSEKFSTLLSLTCCKGNLLANAVNIDAAQISRMKTGARGIPHDRTLLRDISAFFADRLDNEYRLSALYELTNDVRLQSKLDSATLTAVVLEWLTSVEERSYIPVDGFLQHLNSFSENEMRSAYSEKDKYSFEPRYEHLKLYFKNEGKRRALSELISFALSLDSPGTVRLFTDVDDIWLTENEDFLHEFSEGIKLLTEAGFRFQRIQPPTASIDAALRDIRLWLPAYITGALKMFYYPWARDNLHRKTMVVVPGSIALSSSSLYGRREADMTVLTTEPDAVTAYDSYYNGILEQCSSMIKVYTISEKSMVLERIHSLSQDMADGIYKSHRLSAHTLPQNVIQSAQHRSTIYVQNVLASFAQTEQFKVQVLKEHTITDLMCLPLLENVVSGTEPIPGAAAGEDTLFYTLEEYYNHLQKIIWYIEEFPNYRAILLEGTDLENVVIYTKGLDHAMLIKEAEPFALFEITERGLASSISGYLKSLIDDSAAGNSRQATLRRLKSEAANTKKLISRKQSKGKKTKKTQPHTEENAER